MNRRHLVRCIPWFGRRVSEGTTPPLGPTGLFSIVWVCRAAAAAMLKRVGLRCVADEPAFDDRQKQNVDPESLRFLGPDGERINADDDALGLELEEGDM